MSSKSQIDGEMTRSLRSNSQNSELEMLSKKIARCSQEISNLTKEMHNKWSVKIQKASYQDMDSQKLDTSSSSQEGRSKSLKNEMSKIGETIVTLEKKKKSYEKKLGKLRHKGDDKHAADKNSLSSNPNEKDTSSLSKSTIEPHISINEPLSESHSQTPFSIRTNNNDDNETNNHTFSGKTELPSLGNDSYSFANTSVPSIYVRKSSSNEDMSPKKNMSSTFLPGAATSSNFGKAYFDENGQSMHHNMLSSTSTVETTNFNINEFYHINREMILIVEKELYGIKDQYAKLQNDVDELHKNNKQNTETVLEEVSESHLKTNKNMQEVLMSVIKQNDKKFEDLKMSLKNSFQALEYNLTNNNLEVREELVSIRNKIQGLENSHKTQQVHLENPSNYHQLFTKLFDIILTLCAIFLLILNSIINSLKYFFSSVPRFVYVLVFALVFVYNYQHADPTKTTGLQQVEHYFKSFWSSPA